MTEDEEKHFGELPSPARQSVSRSLALTQDPTEPDAGAVVGERHRPATFWSDRLEQQVNEGVTAAARDFSAELVALIRDYSDVPVGLVIPIAPPPPPTTVKLIHQAALHTTPLALCLMINAALSSRWLIESQDSASAPILPVSGASATIAAGFAWNLRRAESSADPRVMRLLPAVSATLATLSLLMMADSTESAGVASSISEGILLLIVTSLIYADYRRRA